MTYPEMKTSLDSVGQNPTFLNIIIFIATPLFFALVFYIVRQIRNNKASGQALAHISKQEFSIEELEETSVS